MAAENRWARWAPEFAAALDHHRAGRLERAAAFYRRILDKAPDHPDALHMLGVIATAQGRPGRAIQLIGRAMGALAAVPDAHLNLGNAYRNVGDRARAIACYRAAIALRSDFAAAHWSLGRELSAARDFAGALSICQRATALDSGIPEAWFHTGVAWHGLGRLGEAEAALRRALGLRPDFIEALRTLAMIAVEQSRFEPALAIQQRVVALRPGDPAGHRMLAVLLFRAGQTDAALDAFRRTVEMAPGCAPAWTSFGLVYRALGRFEEAVACFERALAIDPDDTEARRNLAITGQDRVHEPELERLRTRLDDEALPAAERIGAGFAGGTLLDKADRFDEAFACFSKANALFRQGLLETGRGYNPAGMEQRVDALLASYSPRTLTAIAAVGDPSDRPVFIVGMPRSGTTLVEQILASHSQVFGAGELPDIGAIAARLPIPFDEPDRWASTAKPLAAAYLGRLATLGGTATRVTDKQPDNLLHLGLIATLFPAARIILCDRDPRDTCLSNYFQLFAGGNPWSYDLAECGHRCQEAARLTRCWRSALPLAMHAVRYEALVADLEGESRRLLDFLGLHWEPACLEFHRTERAVLTPSTWQVRQRLFTRSVGRWRHYAHHLGPLLAALEA